MELYLGGLSPAAGPTSGLGKLLFLLVWEARPRGELAMTDAAMWLVGGELVLAQSQRRGK